MLKTAVQALTQTTSESLFQTWQAAFDLGEVNITFFYPISGYEYRVDNFLVWRQKKHLNDAFVIELRIDNIEDVDDLKKILKTCNKGVIIKNAELLFEPILHKVYFHLLEWNRYSQKGVVLLYEGFHTEISPLNIAQFADAFQHISFFPLLNLKDTSQFVEYLKIKWRKNITIDTKLVHKLTGGHTWLVKEIMRQIIKNNISLDQAILTPEYGFKSRLIFNKLSPAHISILESIIRKDNIDCTSPGLHDLIQMGFVWKSKSGFSLPVFLHKNLLHTVGPITFQDNRLIYNKTDVTANFSYQETVFLRELLAHKNDYVTRQNIARHLWPAGDYTDWNFDQLVSRTRKKLGKLGIDPKIIKVQRRRGVGLQI